VPRAQSSRPSLRTAATLAISLLAALLIAACGDEEEAQKLTYTLTGQGKEATFDAPQSAEPGLAEITLKNEGDGEADLQLIRVEGDHTPEEVVEGLGNATKAEAFPDWFFAGGGVGTTGPGESRTVSQVLEPGTYYAFNTEGGPPDPKAAVPALEVSGDASDETVEADDTVSAFDYGFEAETLPSGSVEIAYENTGAQPHHLIASPLIGDATAEDVERFFKTEKGEPPLREEGTQSTAVTEGGEGQLVTLDLEPGRYALYCFISDREGGPPHAIKGMVDEVEVQ
jgi:hypothetical protein